MCVLSGNEIRRRKNDIFESGYDDKCVDNAAYNLRINDKFLIINGEFYDEERPYNDVLIKLPAKKVSVISTIEKLKLSEKLCARVGITFKFSRKGLIPLFGPQIDPGYNGHFYAVVYNTNNKHVPIQKGDKILKMEIYTLEENEEEDKVKEGTKGKKDANIYETQFPFDSREIDELMEITKEETIGKEKLEENIRILENKIENINSKVEEATSGYKSVVWFGILLISTTIFGVILSLLLSFANYAKFANLIDNYWFFGILFLIVILFIVGWILTLDAIIKNIKR